MAKKENNIEIDMIRIICCVMVVIIHAPDFYGTVGKVLIHSVIHCAVPCFMAVSGYLIFFRREYEYRQILFGPFKRYLIVYLIWAAIYICYSYVQTDQMENFFRYAIINSEGWHLWYLKVYLQIIVVYPLVRAITSKRSLTLLYSVLWFVFFSVRFTIGCIPGVEFIFLRLIQLPFVEYPGYIAGTTLAYYPMECLGMFITGGGFLSYIEELKKNEECSSCYKKTLRSFMAVGLIGVIFAFVAISIASRIDTKEGFAAGVTQSHFYFVMVAIGLISAVYLVLSQVNTKKIHDMVGFLADKTLGIYILHPLIISLLQKYLALDEGGVYYKWNNSFGHSRNIFSNCGDCACSGAEKNKEVCFMMNLRSYNFFISNLRKGQRDIVVGQKQRKITKIIYEKGRLLWLYSMSCGLPCGSYCHEIG